MVSLLRDRDKMVGIDPVEISSHSTRKTIPTILYKESGGNLKACKEILGQKNISNTAAYIGVSEDEAFKLKRSIII